MSSLQTVAEWRDVTPDRFRTEILPSGKPALLRGHVAHWPAVRAGRESPAAMVAYLRGFDRGANAHLMTADASIGGHFFYDDDLTGLNFQNSQVPFAAALTQLLAQLDHPAPPAYYVGALPLPENLPGFARDNALSLLDPAIVPRIWLGNRLTVQTHYDLSYNIACVAAGRRRFTLFPPEQFENLYVGPLEFTPAGQPISLVRLDAPDYEKYPRFRDALPHAQVAEMEPGDALFVPYMWWHNVESLDRFNVLVNYWWDEIPAWQGSAFEALLHGILAVRNLPPERRDLWRKLFEHYVFSGGDDALAHLTDRQRGIQGPPSPRLAQVMRTYIAQALMGTRR
ncbi:MAG TPA: cupin-like domain-containing protein [Steroidobacteraceae bacterium]|nr:cupin-like domain-containing protein [Steroidobacteraceae bacterium]